MIRTLGIAAAWTIIGIGLGMLVRAVVVLPQRALDDMNRAERDERDAFERAAGAQRTRSPRIDLPPPTIKPTSTQTERDT